MIESPHCQNTPEWESERLGLPTASCFGKIVTSTGKQSKSRTKYLYELAGERITGEKKPGYYGKSMEKGHERENESRLLYGIQSGVKIETVGLCYKDEKKLFGGSPDGLIGEDGIWENKNAEGHVQLERLFEGWNGSEHHRQNQGNLYITGRNYCILTSYCRGMKPINIVIERDEKFLKILEEELHYFVHDLERMVKEAIA